MESACTNRFCRGLDSGNGTSLPRELRKQQLPSINLQLYKPLYPDAFRHVPWISFRKVHRAYTVNSDGQTPTYLFKSSIKYRTKTQKSKHHFQEPSERCPRQTPRVLIVGYSLNAAIAAYSTPFPQKNVAR